MDTDTKVHGYRYQSTYRLDMYFGIGMRQILRRGVGRIRGAFGVPAVHLRWLPPRRKEAIDIDNAVNARAVIVDVQDKEASPMNAL